MRLYSDLARWWPLMSAPADYAEEAAFYERLMVEASQGPAGTLLELGSGGGNNASFLKKRFEMTLVEPSTGMLAVSQALNPEARHVLGDMRTVRLGRQFDCVFVHDAVVYMLTEADLRRAIETAFVHCRPGGVALFCPDHVRENFLAATEHGGEDGGGRAMRYLSWVWDPDPSDTTYITDYVYAMRDERGQVETVYDRHVEGLFSRRDWLKWLREAGFEAARVPFEHSELEPGSHEVFLCRRTT